MSDTATTAPSTRFSAEEAANAVAGGALLVDVRPEHRRDELGSLVGAQPVAKPDLLAAVRDNRIGRKSPDQKVVVFCGSERGTEEWIQQLTDAGIENVYDVAGGFAALKEAGLPVEAPK